MVASVSGSAPSNGTRKTFARTKLKGEGDATLKQVLLSLLSSRDPLTLGQRRRVLVKWVQYTDRPGVLMTMEALESSMAHLHDTRLRVLAARNCTRRRCSRNKYLVAC
eukprot:5413743-Amphidinium_carterae.1